MLQPACHGPEALTSAVVQNAEDAKGSAHKCPAGQKSSHQPQSFSCHVETNHCCVWCDWYEADLQQVLHHCNALFKAALLTTQR